MKAIGSIAIIAMDALRDALRDGREETGMPLERATIGAIVFLFRGRVGIAGEERKRDSGQIGAI